MAISTNSRTNFNPRNSEPNSPMRRSFTGNSIQRQINTNSPSDNFMGNEEKENEIKPRLPTVVKGTNHFMLPTISAASKINPSPKKKVTSEKNEQLRTSSGSTYMSDFTKDFDQNLEKGLKSPRSDTNHLPKCTSRNSHTPPNFSESSDKRSIMESNKKLFGSSISPIAPLDADPSSFPPYDPKTNYLSPRPQFLHYKPNPRLEFSKNLEDEYLSDSEESDHEIFQKESDDASSVHAINGSVEKEHICGPKNLEDGFLSDSEESDHENFQKESDNASSVQAINGGVEKDFEYASSIKIVKRTSEENKAIKSRFFSRKKVIPLLLVLLIACLSVSHTDSPIFDSPVYHNLSSSKFYEDGFNEFARNLKLWSVSSKSYAIELISSISGRVKSDPLQFSNLTYMTLNPFIKLKRAEEIYEQNEVEPVFSDGNELENDLNLQNEIDFKSCLEEASEISFEEVASEVIVKGDDHLISESEIESSPAISSFENSYVIDISNSEVLNLEQGDHIASNSEFEPTIAVASSGNTFEIGSFQEDCEYKSKIVLLSLEQGDHTAADSEFEPTIAVASSGNTFEIGSFQEDHEFKSQILENSDIEGENSVTSDSKNDPTILNQYEALTITLIAAALMAITSLIYFKKKKSSTGIYTVDINRIPTKKTKISDSSPQVYPSEVDCSSVISSSGKSYSTGKRGTWGISDEAHNQDRKQMMVSKRESLASSTDFSMSDSPSYGSFTTYERLPSKHSFGEDEVITPVRRSIRINKIQATY